MSIVAGAFGLHGRVAELHARAAPRLLVAQAFGAQLIGALGEMEGELALDVALDLRGAERVRADVEARTSRSLPVRRSGARGRRLR